MNIQQPGVAAFLIDADNLSSSTIEKAFIHLEQSGNRVLIRRAYGGVEKLAAMKELLLRFAIQAFVNQGKGTTDVALVVDAMDMLHRQQLPTTVAIGSSDADFSPLAVRLREAGLRVVCFAEQGKACETLGRAYDKVVFVDIPALVQAVVVVEKPAFVIAVKKSPVPQITNPFPFPLPVVDSIAKTVVQPIVQAVKKAATKSVAASPVAGHTEPVLEGQTTVKQILQAFPGWLPNTIKQLNQLGKPLKDAGISHGNRPLHELFRKHPLYFKVLPSTGAPKQIRLLKNPSPQPANKP